MSPTPKTGNIVASALATPPVLRDASDIAILEATLRCLTRYGIERMTVEDVARTAGVGRATVFRRFESKDTLIREALALELQRLISEFETKAKSFDDPYNRLFELSVETVRLIRTHPVARRLVEDETALPLHRDPRVAEFQLVGLRRDISQAAKDLGVKVDARAMAELLMRFFGSLWIAPDIGLGVDNEAHIRTMIAILLAPLRPQKRDATG
ncbi:TetR family transcriptional regulator [Mycolicibacterium moriokaense]|nr:TetR/AcrR family transcriptional regulator [Mycolicibacterium moriokaense]ORB19933.1 TetR family transcriptional regulator [Mycolicibacterium moriokaense]